MKKGMQTGQTHMHALSQSLNTLVGQFGTLPPVVTQAERSLESMSGSGVKGMSGLGLAAGGAVAALGLALGVGLKAIDTYENLAGRVENYRRVVGGSAEDSGRMVQTMEALGVQGEQAALSMFRFSKALETHPAKLEALGVSVAHNAKGNVDLSASLFNIADAYNATGDQAKRNQILFDAFGRSGRDMIPVLEQGSAALKQLNEQARLTFTDADLARAKEMKIKDHEVNQVWEDMWATLGQKLLPAKEAFSDAVLRGDYEQRRLNEAVKAGTITYEEYSSNVDYAGTKARKLRDEWDKQYDASRKVTHAINEQTQATNDATAATQAQYEAESKLVQEEEARINASYAMKLADLAVAENAIHLREALDRVALAQDKVATSQQAVTDAGNRYGKSSIEYRKAVDELRKAQDDLTLSQDDVTKTTIQNERNVLAAAAAARKLQEDTDLAATGQKDAAKETQAYVDKLYAEAQTLAPGSELRKNIQGLIDDIGRVPTQVVTQFQEQRAAASVKRNERKMAAEEGYASGGRPTVGVPAWVGERGPEIWTPDQPGTITPAGQPPPPQGSSDIHVHGPLVAAQTNADSHDIAVDASWELRKLRRNN